MNEQTKGSRWGRDPTLGEANMRKRSQREPGRKWRKVFKTSGVVWDKKQTMERGRQRMGLEQA